MGSVVAQPVQTFGEFRVDHVNQSLWRGQEEQRLTYKAFAVLCQLLDHASHTVTKEELFQRVWPETVVGNATLAVCIRELRQALGDNARQPQYIETIHQRGLPAKNPSR